MQEVDLPEGLAGRRIREVDLDERPVDREQRVAQGDARVGQAARVDDRDVEVAAMQPVDQGALVVRLEEVDGEPELGGAGRQPGVDLVERLVAVDLRLARADEVEVRPSRTRTAVIAAPRSRSSRLAVIEEARGGALDERRLDVVADDDAIGRGQDQPQSAGGVLLVGGEMSEHRRQRVGEWLGRELEAVEQPADPLGPVRAASRRPPGRSGGPRAGRMRRPRRGAARHSPPPPRRRARPSARD